MPRIEESSLRNFTWNELRNTFRTTTSVEKIVDKIVEQCPDLASLENRNLIAKKISELNKNDAPSPDRVTVKGNLILALPETCAKQIGADSWSKKNTTKKTT